MKPGPRIAVGIAILALAAAGALGAYWLAAPTTPQRPAFTLDDLQGHPRPISEFDGDVVVLNFWASWCAPCRREIPMLVAAQKQWGPEGLQIVGVAIDTRNAAAGFAERYHINYPVLADATDGARVQDRYTDRDTPAAGALPYTVIIDRQGRIVARVAGALTRDTLRQQVQPLLAKPTPQASTGARRKPRPHGA